MCWVGNFRLAHDLLLRSFEPPPLLTFRAPCQNDQMAVNPMAQHLRGSSQWELSKLPVLKEKFASAGTFWTTTGAKLSEIPWRRVQLPLRTACPPRCVNPRPTKRWANLETWKVCSDRLGSCSSETKFTRFRLQSFRPPAVAERTANPPITLRQNCSCKVPQALANFSFNTGNFDSSHCDEPRRSCAIGLTAI